MFQLHLVGSLFHLVVGASQNYAMYTYTIPIWYSYIINIPIACGICGIALWGKDYYNYKMLNFLILL